jgi:hypothetical protein
MVDPIRIVCILNAHPHPDVVVPRKLSSEFNESLRSLGQNLERMPIGFSHYIKNGTYKIQGHIRVEKIAHRIDEDLPRVIPP